MNYGMIRYTLGCVLNIEAAAMLLPAICAVCYGEMQSLTVFLLCVLICLAVGFILTIKKPADRSMYSREGFTSVALSWIALSIFGALPFVISGYIPNYVDALFETASGFTTTGASILTDIEALPNSMLFWRSFTHWLGGMGVLVFLVAIMPLSGGKNLYILKAESPGPSVGKLVPKVKSSAKILYLIYLGITLVEIALLLAGGMNLFDALITSFGTAGTGGFGNKNTSLAEFSPYCQNVVTVFMIIFGMDFSLYYLILSRRVVTALKSEEYRAYLGIIAVSTIIVTLNCLHLYPNFATSLRHGAFQVASIITTTGFSTVDFNTWPTLSKTILVLIAFVGACAGSTGGGIKVSRILILFKTIKKEIKIVAHPRSTHKVSLNGRPIEHETVRAINVFLAVYFVIFAISLLIISIDNLDFTTNFTAVTATINNIGPGLELVGPTGNFSMFSPISKICLTLDMLIGRLEIFPMLILLSPYTWKN